MKGKKSIKRTAAILFVGAACVMGGASVSALGKVDAATTTYTVVKEQFSSETRAENWLKDDFKQDEQAYYSMRFDNFKDYGAAVLYKDYTVKGNCEITFDFRQSDVDVERERDNWFGLLFGYNDQSAHYTNGNAVVLSYGRSETLLQDDGDGTSDKLVDGTYNIHTKHKVSFLRESLNKTNTIRVCVRYAGEDKATARTLYTIDVYFFEKGGVCPDKPQVSYSNVEAEGYFGFSAMATAQIDVSNLQFFENGVKVAGDDFTDDKGEPEDILSRNPEHTHWKTINCSDVKLYTQYNGRVYADASGMLVSKAVLTADKRNDKIFSMSYDVEVESFAVDSAFGFTLGLDTASATVNDGTFIGFERIDENSFVFIHKQNGETIKRSQPLQAYLTDTPFHVEMVGYYDGAVELRALHYTSSFACLDTDGHFALTTLGDTPCAVYFDNVVVEQTRFQTFNFGNQAINFLGSKKKTIAGYEIKTPYIDESKWYLGTGVTPALSYDASNMYVNFTDKQISGSTKFLEKAFFGPKQTYSEFICRFGVTVVQNREDAIGTSIGLSFGKNYVNDQAKLASGLFFKCTEDGMVIEGRNGVLQNADDDGVLRQYKTNPELDFWSQDKWEEGTVTYRVMVVVRNQTAYLYYANAADTSGMDVCKAVITDVKTDGFVTVAGLGGATFRLKDFAITNIESNAHVSAVYNENVVDNEYVATGFENEKTYALSGNATKTKTGVSLQNGATVDLKEKFTNFLAYVDVNGMAGSGIRVQVGVDAIDIHEDGNATSSTLTKIYSGKPLDFTAFKQGGVITVEAIGTKIYVGAISNDVPESQAENWIAVFETAKRTSAVTLSVSALDNTLISVHGIRAFTLKPQISITVDDWNEAREQIAEKPAKQEEGCSSVLSVGGVLSAVAGLGTAFTMRRRENDDA